MMFGGFRCPHLPFRVTNNRTMMQKSIGGVFGEDNRVRGGEIKGKTTMFSRLYLCFHTSDSFNATVVWRNVQQVRVGALGASSFVVESLPSRILKLGSSRSRRRSLTFNHWRLRDFEWRMEAATWTLLRLLLCLKRHCNCNNTQQSTLSDGEG
jgi:hypothetical protein